MNDGRYHCLLYEYAEIDENNEFDPLETGKWFVDGVTDIYEARSAKDAAEEFAVFYHTLGEDSWDDERYDVLVYDIHNNRFYRFNTYVETSISHTASATEGEL